jgi:hypothetical protein
MSTDDGHAHPWAQIGRPEDYRKQMEFYLREHAAMFRAVGDDNTDRQPKHAVALASAASSGLACALGYVAARWGQTAADEMAGVVGHYIANGGDDCELFPPDLADETDTSLVLAVRREVRS